MFADPVFLALTVYSTIATLTVIILLLYIYRLKRRLKNHKHSKETDKMLDLEKLHRISIPNKYELNSPPQQQKSNLSRTQSLQMIPKKHKRVSMYDSATCTSNSQIKQTINHYEEPTTVEPHHYETIIDNVVSTLSEVFENATKEESLHEEFLVALALKLRQTNFTLYTSLQNLKKNLYQYEEIKKNMQEENVDRNSDEAGYQKFVLVKNDKIKHQVSYGSDDHLKYLVARKNPLNNVDAPYMQATRFSAKSDCPENLQRLCNRQDSPSTSVVRNEENKRASRTIEIIAEENVPDLREKFEFKSSCKISSDPRIKMVERVLQKPPWPPKKTKISSHMEEEEVLQ